MNIEELNNSLNGAYADWIKHFQVWPCIQALGIKPYKDGNKWCFLYGDNIQEGIAGFGDTIIKPLMIFTMNLEEKEAWNDNNNL